MQNERLEDLCDSDELSIDALRYQVGLIPPNATAVQNSSFLHGACRNENVTLPIIDCLLDAFPGAASIGATFFCDNANGQWATSYPLHLACCNSRCPNSIIRMLVEKYPLAFRHLCMVEDGYMNSFPGLPLHYYFSRPHGIELDTVKMLVEAHPQALTTADDEGITPILTLLYIWYMNSRYEILNFIVKSEPLSTILASSLRIAGVDGSVPLHMACKNEHIESDTIQLLVNVCPEAVFQTDEYGYLPIHRLCQNSSLHETALVNILKIFIKINSHIGVNQFLYATNIEDMRGGHLPIHVALINDMSPKFCKVLIDACPESVRITCGAGDLAIHAACESYLTEWKRDPTLRRQWSEDPCTLVKYLFDIT